jgi:hypothetical protein
LLGYSAFHIPRSPFSIHFGVALSGFSRFEVRSSEFDVPGSPIEDWRYGGGWTTGSGDWTFSGLAPQVSAGGNPGGHLENTDTSDWTYWFTPEAWAGDWRGLESVSFDFKVIQGTAANLLGTRMISVCSPWTNLHADVLTMPVPGQWMHYEFALTPATFGVSAETFEKVMRDVVLLGIRSEWINGSEREGLDNYRLSKAPDSYWSWISSYFTGTDLTDEDKTGKFADPDGDGADNWSEYVAGTVPTNKLEYLRLQLLGVTNGVCALGFQTTNGRLYGVDCRLDLALGGSWSAVTNDLPGNGLLASVFHPAGNAPQFYRLRVRLAD